MGWTPVAPLKLQAELVENFWALPFDKKPVVLSANYPIVPGTSLFLLRIKSSKTIADLTVISNSDPSAVSSLGRGWCIKRLHLLTPGREDGEL